MSGMLPSRELQWQSALTVINTSVVIVVHLAQSQPGVRRDVKPGTQIYPRDIQFLPHGQRLLRTGGIMALPLAHMGR